MLNFTGYAIELEDKEYLQSSSTPAQMRMMGDLPARVDIRQSDLFKNSKWLKVEQQGNIGSCQGNALTECGEYSYCILSGKVVQLSRMYAYLRSQQFDNIKKDNGSTLSGGTKCAKEGICLESITGYPPSYPGWGWITQEMKTDAINYVLKTHTVINHEEEVKTFIGSGIGIVQIGIPWGNAMNPDSNGCVKSFSAGNGGHSITLCGYVPDSDVGIKSSKGYWYILKNSWGTNWSPLNGFAYIDPRAVSQMLAHRYTTMIGRSDMDVPTPRPVRIDFTLPGNSING